MKYIDIMSILIEKNLDKKDYVDYLFICDTWIKDPRYKKRNMKIGETRGLFRINKTTLQPELLIAMEGDEDNNRFYRAASKIIKDYKLTNNFPDKAHFASG